MEYHKTFRLLYKSIISKFVTRKWIKLNDLSNVQYSVNMYKYIRLKTLMLRSDLCDYSDVFIVVKKTDLLVSADNENDKAQTEADVTFKITLHLLHAYQKSRTHS